MSIKNMRRVAHRRAKEAYEEMAISHEPGGNSFRPVYVLFFLRLFLHSLSARRPESLQRRPPDSV